MNKMTPLLLPALVFGAIALFAAGYAFQSFSAVIQTAKEEGNMNWHAFLEGEFALLFSYRFFSVVTCRFYISSQGSG
jgi:hypothetical protein